MSRFHTDRDEYGFPILVRGAARIVRQQKRREAEARNAITPNHRRRAVREGRAS